MKIIWAPEAINNLNTIYNFHLQFNPQVANRIYNQIIDGTDILINFPYIAASEPLLEDEEEIFRSLLIAEKFKIIYMIEKEMIQIVNVWDCRQNPEIHKQKVQELNKNKRVKKKE